MLESVSPLHHGLDLRIQAFDHPVRHPGVQESDHAFPIPLDRPGRLNVGLQPAMDCPEVPFFKIPQRFMGVRHLPKSSQGQLQVISPGRPQVQLLQRPKPSLLPGGQVFRIFQPEEPALFKTDMVTLFFPSNPFDRFIELAHDVKPVKHHSGFGQEPTDPVQVRVSHVAANDVDSGGIESSRSKILDKSLDHPLFPPFPQEKRTREASKSPNDVM